jgi:hypothetical protein
MIIIFLETEALFSWHGEQHEQGQFIPGTGK